MGLLAALIWESHTHVSYLLGLGLLKQAQIQEIQKTYKCFIII